MDICILWHAFLNPNRFDCSQRHWLDLANSLQWVIFQQQQTKPRSRQLLKCKNMCFITYQDVSISHEFNFTQTRNFSAANFVEKEEIIIFFHSLFCFYSSAEVFLHFFYTYARHFHFIIALTFYCMLIASIATSTKLACYK